ncbi:MAG: DUF5317 domain-containing protein [Bacillota bacterium]|jgi:hypothetical protein
MFAFVAVLAIAVGACLGGKIARLGDVEIPRFRFLLASLVCGAVLALPVFQSAPADLNLPFLITLLSYGFLFYSLFPSLHLPGLKCVGVGALMNFLVETANRGRMPVSLAGFPEDVVSAELQKLAHSLTHQPIGPHTRLVFLADLYRFRLPGLRSSMFSLGDAVLGIGIAWFIISVMVRGFPQSSVDGSID